MEQLDKSKNEPLRINRYLAQCGLGARRKCDELVAAGHIYVNGQKITELGVKIIPGVDNVEYRGNQVKNLVHLQYYAYHKPNSVMVTRMDPEGRVTIYDRLLSKGKDLIHMRHVGRLDYHSEGLLLLTNDGDLIHALTHPRFHIKKVYSVRLDRALEQADLQKMLNGIESLDQILHAAEISVEKQPLASGEFWYEVVLFEGKNRQIRRMFEALGYSIRQLIRKQFGSVKLAQLPVDTVRVLTEREIGALKNARHQE